MQAEGVQTDLCPVVGQSGGRGLLARITGFVIDQFPNRYPGTETNGRLPPWLRVAQRSMNRQFQPGLSGNQSPLSNFGPDKSFNMSPDVGG